MSINKADAAYNMIKEAILTQEFPPKFHLKELELSEKLSLSRTPIREAIHRLTAEGFIEENENQISTVSDISLDNFIDIYQIRDSLEVLSVSLASKNWSDENKILEINEILKKQMESAEDLDCEVIPDDIGDFLNTETNRKYLKYDKLFHIKIAELSNNKLLHEETIKILDLYYRYNHFLTVKKRSKMDVYEHTEIFEAIKDRNTKYAIMFIREHLQSVRESILIGISKKNIKN